MSRKQKFLDPKSLMKEIKAMSTEDAINVYTYTFGCTKTEFARISDTCAKSINKDYCVKRSDVYNCLYNHTNPKPEKTIAMRMAVAMLSRGLVTNTSYGKYNSTKAHLQ